MNEGKKRTLILGLVFLFFLFLAYGENTAFFVYIQGSFVTNPLLAVLLLFVHNILAVSLIILGMSFYVELVLNFMRKRQIEYVVLQNPNIFAVVFTVMIVVLSIFRAFTLVNREIDFGTLTLVVLISLPNGLVEGFGIFQGIRKTLAKKLTTRSLGFIYSIFFLAAVIEVGFIQLLPLISAR